MSGWSFEVNNWQADLFRAARNAKCEFSSVDVITNEAHGRAATALLGAFEHDASCSIFAEARTPERTLQENARPADILILHPELGVLFVEVKGWTLDKITRINAGTVYREVNGYQELKNPWEQVQRAAGQLQKATRKVLRQRRLPESQAPYFDCLVAFPNITRASWLSSKHAESLNFDEVLFTEDLESLQGLRALLIRRLKAKAGYRLPCSREKLANVRQALGDSAVINRRRRVQVPVSETLSALIDTAEVRQKRFTPEQQELIEAEFDGRPQLVRGVAGSGKTAVLIKNFVNMLDRKLNTGQLLLHQEPRSERFLIVCYNQSLVPLLKQQFENAFRELNHQEIPKCVVITYVNGLEYAMCNDSSRLLDYQRWEGHKENADEATSKLFAASYCQQLDGLISANNPVLRNLQYDAIYVDEGQDLFAEEYRLLMKLLRVDTKTGEKNIVIFYDDAQNLYGRPRPTWAELGIEIRGRTALMRTCLRNPKQIIEFAFNLLLGVSSETRVATKQFAETRFLTQDGLVEELPDRWLVHFAARQDGELPEIALFSTRLAEIDWIVSRLDKLINEKGVAPEDILLIAEKPWIFMPDLEGAICGRFPKMERLLKPWGKKEGHKSNPDKKKYLLQNGLLTLATVKAAKGYDCPIVLLIGADLFPGTVEGRASFYVAATRAKMRLYVTGLRVAASLAEEAEKVAALLATPPKPVPDAPTAAATRNADTAFKPLFRAGDTVIHLGQYRKVAKVGKVVADAVAHTSPSQKHSYQTVQVEFEGKIKTFTVPPAPLELVQAKAGE